MKNQFTKFTVILFLVIAAGFLLTTSFKQAKEEEKKVMVIRILYFGSKTGLYVCLDGQEIERISLLPLSAKPDDAIQNTNDISKVLNKYYNQGWKLVGTNEVHFILEK